MKNHAISQTRTRSEHSSRPTAEPTVSPPIVIFCVLCFMIFFAPGFVLFRCNCFLVLSWSWFFFGSLFLRFVDFIKAYIYVLKSSSPTHLIYVDILYSNKGLDVESSSSNTPPHNYINNLKCIEWKRPHDGHYRPKHVVFWPRIQHLLKQ